MSRRRSADATSLRVDDHRRDGADRLTHATLCRRPDAPSGSLGASNHDELRRRELSIHIYNGLAVMVTGNGAKNRRLRRPRTSAPCRRETTRTTNGASHTTFTVQPPQSRAYDYTRSLPGKPVRDHITPRPTPSEPIDDRQQTPRPDVRRRRVDTAVSRQRRLRRGRGRNRRAGAGRRDGPVPVPRRASGHGHRLRARLVGRRCDRSSRRLRAVRGERT